MKQYVFCQQCTTEGSLEKKTKVHHARFLFDVCNPSLHIDFQLEQLMFLFEKFVSIRFHNKLNL